MPHKSPVPHSVSACRIIYSRNKKAAGTSCSSRLCVGVQAGLCCAPLFFSLFFFLHKKATFPSAAPLWFIPGKSSSRQRYMCVIWSIYSFQHPTWMAHKEKVERETEVLPPPSLKTACGHANLVCHRFNSNFFPCKIYKDFEL